MSFLFEGKERMNWRKRERERHEEKVAHRQTDARTTRHKLRPIDSSVASFLSFDF